MTTKGHFFSTATIKHFQTENIQVHPSERKGPLPVRILQPYMVLENP